MTKEVHDELKTNFLTSSPDMAAVIAFFKQLNEKIHKANTDHFAHSENGLIPEDTYQILYNHWIVHLKDAKAENNAKSTWNTYNDTYKKFQAFN